MMLHHPNFNDLENTEDGIEITRKSSDDDALKDVQVLKAERF